MKKNDNIFEEVSLGCALGESPVWDSVSQTLNFVDIKSNTLFRYKEKKFCKPYLINQELSAVCLSKFIDNLVLTNKSSISSFNFSSKKFNQIKQNNFEPINNRFNETKIDSKGRLWFASMDNNERLATGSLWNYDPLEKKFLKHYDEFVIGNGIDWNLDNTKMYFTDSVKRVIYAFDFDEEIGTLGERKVFAKIDPMLGYPDGLTVDSEGFVWSAIWDGWCILRFSPDGLIDRLIELDFPRPTSIAFGGKDMKKLFITSARFGLTKQEINSAPKSGSLCSIETCFLGRQPYKFGGRF